MRAPARLSLRHRIAEHLRERLLAGEFAPGARLPSEPDLARSLGVSRSSLRSGIALLEEDGLLRRRHGSGTYVTDKPLLRNDLSRNFSVSTMIAATGVRAGTLLARAGREAAPAEVAAAFGISAGFPLSVLRRVRTADGRRVVDTTDWCRHDALDPPALAKIGSIYLALADRGLTVEALGEVRRAVPDRRRLVWPDGGPQSRAPDPLAARGQRVRAPRRAGRDAHGRSGPHQPGLRRGRRAR